MVNELGRAGVDDDEVVQLLLVRLQGVLAAARDRARVALALRRPVDGVALRVFFGEHQQDLPTKQTRDTSICQSVTIKKAQLVKATLVLARRRHTYRHGTSHVPSWAAV